MSILAIHMTGFVAGQWEKNYYASRRDPQSLMPNIVQKRFPKVSSTPAHPDSSEAPKNSLPARPLPAPATTTRRPTLRIAPHRSASLRPNAPASSGPSVLRSFHSSSASKLPSSAPPWRPRRSATAGAVEDAAVTEWRAHGMRGALVSWGGWGGCWDDLG